MIRTAQRRTSRPREDLRDTACGINRPPRGFRCAIPVSGWRGPHATARHCEKRSDEAIHVSACGAMDCFRLRSLSYGGQVASLAMTAMLRDRLLGSLTFESVAIHLPAAATSLVQRIPSGLRSSAHCEHWASAHNGQRQQRVEPTDGCKAAVPFRREPAPAKASLTSSVIRRGAAHDSKPFLNGAVSDFVPPVTDRSLCYCVQLKNRPCEPDQTTGGETG